MAEGKSEMRWSKWYDNVITNHDANYFRNGIFGSYNKMWISGMFLEDFVFVQKIEGTRYYLSKLQAIKRTGVCNIPVITTEDMLKKHGITYKVKGKFAEIAGEYRSANYEGIDGKSHLFFYGYAKMLHVCECVTELKENANTNLVYLSGFIAKEPLARISPEQKIPITDIYVSVARKGKYVAEGVDFIPCVTWYEKADYASTFSKRERVILYGIIMSREYNVVDEFGASYTREINEVSIIDLKRVDV